MEEEKSALRRRLKQLTAQLSFAERERLSEALAQKVLQNAHFIAAPEVMLYSALPDEPATAAIIARSLALGKRVWLPVVCGADIFAAPYTADMPLHRGAFGILEPQSSSPAPRLLAVLPPTSPPIFALIPGLAFDASGRRLGRGRGFYDRFLLRNPYLHTCGICFPHALVSSVPCETHDIAVKEVVRLGED